MRPGSAYRLRLKCSEVFEQGFFQDNGYYGNDKRTIIGHVDVTGRYLRPYINGDRAKQCVQAGGSDSWVETTLSGRAILRPRRGFVRSIQYRFTRLVIYGLRCK